MCEILVRVTDKVNEKDPLQDALCLKRNEAIAVCEDGHPWSKLERSNPDWRIIALPGIPRRQMTYLLEPDKIKLDKLGVEVMTRLRKQCVNLDSPVFSGKTDQPADREGDYSKVVMDKLELDASIKESRLVAEVVSAEIARKAEARSLVKG
jgi:hypothetical protein